MFSGPTAAAGVHLDVVVAGGQGEARDLEARRQQRPASQVGGLQRHGRGGREVEHERGVLVAALAWVPSLPHRVRYTCAFDHRTRAGVRKILVRTLASFYCRDAKARGIANTKTGTIVAIQTFDSALRLNVHWPDGNFACALRRPKSEFHPATQITDEDVDRLVRQIRSRVLRYLRRTGKLTDLDAAHPDAPDPSLFDTLRAAAIEGKTAFGTRAGRNDPRIRPAARLFAC